MGIYQGIYKELGVNKLAVALIDWKLQKHLLDVGIDRVFNGQVLTLSYRQRQCLPIKMNR